MHNSTSSVVSISRCTLMRHAANLGLPYLFVFPLDFRPSPSDYGLSPSPARILPARPKAATSGLSSDIFATGHRAPPRRRGPFWRPAHMYTEMTSPLSLSVSPFLPYLAYHSHHFCFLFCCYVGHFRGDPVESYVPRAGNRSGGRYWSRFSSSSFASAQTIIPMNSHPYSMYVSLDKSR